MRENKRILWIKLPVNHFEKLAQRKMRKQPNGAYMQVLYIRLLLMACKNAGVIEYQGVYDTIAEEIAETAGEAVQDIENALAYYEHEGLIEYRDSNIFIPEAVEIVGSESESAERVRRHREKLKALQCNDIVTACNDIVTACNVEGEGEEEEEKEGEEEEEEEEEETPAPAEPLQTYGRYNRVEMPAKEYTALINDYGEATAKEYINKADIYGEKQGRNITDGHLFIRRMLAEDGRPERKAEAKAKTKDNEALKAIERLYIESVNKGG